MRIIEAVDEYVAKRRAEGCLFVSAESKLRMLCRSCGDIELSTLSGEQIFLFTNSGNCSQVTRIHKFSAAKCFVDYWTRHGQMPALVLQKPARPSAPRGLYIYTPAEVRTILRAAEKCQQRCRKLSGSTLRTMLATIYATGARLDEVLTVRVSGINLKRRCIAFESSVSRAGRTLPIGPDLRAILAMYLALAGRRKGEDGSLFRGKKDDYVSRNYINTRFVRLCRMVGLQKKPDGRTPRLLDLRYTFAVHRLTHWIRQGADLNVLLPALSTYMGYASLTAAEKFLSYTPERFKIDLQKLSPAKGRRHWRDDPELMSLLGSL